MVSSVLHAGGNDHESEGLVFGTWADLPLIAILILIGRL